MTDGKQPAFSEVHIHHWKAQDKEVGETDNVIPRWNGGLTKREYFAAMALQGMLACPIPIDKDNRTSVQRLSVILADALIAELN